MVIQVTMWKHIWALWGSIPPSLVIGMVRANTRRQLAMMMISARMLSFFM